MDAGGRSGRVGEGRTWRDQLGVMFTLVFSSWLPWSTLEYEREGEGEGGATPSNTLPAFGSS